MLDAATANDLHLHVSYSTNVSHLQIGLVGALSTVLPTWVCMKLGSTDVYPAAAGWLRFRADQSPQARKRDDIGEFIQNENPFAATKMDELFNEAAGTRSPAREELPERYEEAVSGRIWNRSK
jgi:hypothetical protein